MYIYIYAWLFLQGFFLFSRGDATTNAGPEYSGCGTMGKQNSLYTCMDVILYNLFGCMYITILFWGVCNYIICYYIEGKIRAVSVKNTCSACENSKR